MGRKVRSMGFSARQRRQEGGTFITVHSYSSQLLSTSPIQVLNTYPDLNSEHQAGQGGGHSEEDVHADLQGAPVDSAGCHQQCQHTGGQGLGR